MERAPRFGAVNVQGWHDLTFLHWPYPAEAVEALLPPDLRVETAEGCAWVGVTPFAMHAVRPVGLPPLPHLSSFPEVNCRTYVRHANGTRGIWFFSLDTPRLRIIAALRTLGLPYCWARADVAAEPSGATVPRRVAYRGRRLLPRSDGAPAADWRVTVDVGAHLDHPDPLAIFLTARWWAFSRRAGRTWQVPVDHPDWPLRAASAAVADVAGLLAAAGLPRPTGEPLVHFSPGVRSRLGIPRPA